MFRIGQKVTCIDAKDAPMLTLGAIYTIRDLRGPRKQRWRGQSIVGYSVHLHEAEPLRGYTGFAGERFRPYNPRSTDISIFTEMLKTDKIKSNA